MKRNPLVALSIMIGLSLCGSVTSSQTILYNSLGPGGSYHNSGGETAITMGGWDFIRPDHHHWISATSFENKTHSEAELGSITVALSAGDPSLVDLLLMTDAGGVPGNVIEEFSPRPPLLGWDPPPLTTVDSVLHPSLSPGVQYWLAVTTHGPELIPYKNSYMYNTVFWFAADPPFGHLQAFLKDAGPWKADANGLNSALLVVAAVPEPATTGFSLGFVVILASALLRRRHSGGPIVLLGHFSQKSLLLLTQQRYTIGGRASSSG